MSAVIDFTEAAWQAYRDMRLRERAEPHLRHDPAWVRRRNRAFNRFYRMMGR